MEPEHLSNLLGEDPYREAIGVLEMISKTPEDYQYYEDRLKFLRDEEAKLADAKEEGREEGELAGKIRTLQELLGQPATPRDELLAMDTAVLLTLSTELRQRLRDRLA